MQTIWHIICSPLYANQINSGKTLSWHTVLLITSKAVRHDLAVISVSVLAEKAACYELK